MGVGGFWNFLRSQAPDCFSYHDESPLKLKGLRFCVDGTMLLTAALKSSITLNAEEEWLPSFVGSVLRRVEMVVDLTGRIPIIVVDGEHPSCKSHAHTKRAKTRAASEQKLKECIASGDEDGALRAKRAFCRVTPHLEAIVMQALVAAGVEVERAPGEAEDHCARMCISGDAWGVVGEDGDTLICGAPWLLRGLCQGGRLCLVGRDSMLRELGVSPLQLRWLAAFSGSDFHPGLPRVGPSRARKLVLPLANPGASLASLVEDETLHAGLRLAASQFGDWVVCLNDGVVGGLLAGLQRDIIAVVASSVTAPVVNWEATAAALYINRGSTRAIVDILRLMGKEKGTNAFGQGIVVVD